jgi:hypothetical protein
MISGKEEVDVTPKDDIQDIFPGKVTYVKYEGAPLWSAFGLPSWYPRLSSDETPIKFCIERKELTNVIFICASTRTARSMQRCALGYTSFLSSKKIMVQNVEKVQFEDRTFQFITEKQLPREINADCIVVQRNVADLKNIVDEIITPFTLMRVMIGKDYYQFY